MSHNWQYAYSDVLISCIHPTVTDCNSKTVPCLTVYFTTFCLLFSGQHLYGLIILPSRMSLILHLPVKISGHLCPKDNIYIYLCQTGKHTICLPQKQGVVISPCCSLLCPSSFHLSPFSLFSLFSFVLVSSGLSPRWTSTFNEVESAPKWCLSRI